MDNNISNQVAATPQSQAGDEIDFKQIAGALLRHKYLIAKLPSLFLQYRLYAFTQTNPEVSSKLF